MKNLRSRLTLLGGALLMLAFSSIASAQATRTWVSGVGDDVNPCSRTAPCKTFAGAISKTANGGEIDCLDPGGFGAVTITKSITIDCDSGAGGVLAGGTNGINVVATASDIIVLRNLTVNGAGNGVNNITGINGINVTSAKAVGLEDVVINNWSQSCLTVSDTSSAVVVYADDSKFINCNASNNGGAAAVFAGQNAKVTITRSLIAMSPGPGIAQGSTGSQVFITGSTIASVGNALQSSAGNFIGASGNTFANNGAIFVQNGGQIFTGSDNPGFGNGPAGPTTGAVTKN
jgi:hypothetical protein